MISALALAVTLVAAGTGAPAGQKLWIVTCDLTRAAGAEVGANGPRTFRIGPNLFEKWEPVGKQFGPNLCGSLTCRMTKGVLEADVASATLIVTISLDPAAGRATWRSQGASNLNATSGICSLKPNDIPPPKPTPPGMF